MRLLKTIGTVAISYALIVLFVPVFVAIYLFIMPSIAWGHFAKMPVDPEYRKQKESEKVICPDIFWK